MTMAYDHWIQLGTIHLIILSLEARLSQHIAVFADARLLAATMAPKRLPKTTLADLRATASADEMAQAREILKKAKEDPTGKAAKTKMAQMAHWLKEYGGDANQAARASRGSDREEYLLAFFVHKMREGKGTTTTEHISETEDNKKKAVYRWSAARMDAEFGPAKGAYLRENKCVDWEPCSISGKEDEHLRDWIIPVSWTELGEKNIKKFGIKGEAATQDGDHDLLQSTFSGREGREGETPGSSSNDPAPVVDAKIDALAKLEGKIQHLTENITAVTRKYQDMELVTKQQRTRLETIVDVEEKRFTAALLTDVSGHATRVEKTVKILSQMATGKIDETLLPKLVSTLESIDEKHDKCVTWSDKLGHPMTTDGSKRKRAPKAKAE